jgi:glycosyltransferase involved in cell wall biosynthesis
VESRPGVGYISDSEIAIRPLTDDEWTRGKGGFTSVVQAMALELPVVVTQVSYLDEIVEDGTSRFHATTGSDWESSPRRLITNPDKRLQMGRNARSRVDRLNFWTADRAAELSEILQDVRRRND